MSAAVGIVLGALVIAGGVAALIAVHARKREPAEPVVYGDRGHVTITSAPASRPTYEPVVDLESARPGLGLPLGPEDPAEFATT